MDVVVRPLKGVFIYVDDILVTSRDHATHMDHLTALFHRLSQYGLVVNPTKSILGADSINFFGHNVSAEGICPLGDRVKFIQDFPEPTTKKNFRSSLELLTFIIDFFQGVLMLRLHCISGWPAFKSLRLMILSLYNEPKNFDNHLTPSKNW